MSNNSESSLAKRVSEKARVEATKDLVDLHHADYIRIRETNTRNSALRILRERYPGQWRTLLVGWRQHLATEMGHVDGRKAKKS
jgi:hypothetical protein